jgi:hypothetical protein
LGATVALSLVLAKTDDVALIFDEVRAYPNGFTFSLVTVRNPMAPREPFDHGLPWRFHGPGGSRGPRLGLELADGAQLRGDDFGPGGSFGGSRSTVLLRTTAGPDDMTTHPNPFGLRTDADGIPVEPFLHFQGSGGSMDRFTTTYWCFPLPPPGPMTVYVEWADQGIEETAVSFDTGLIRESAPRAITLWEPES